MTSVATVVYDVEDLPRCPYNGNGHTFPAWSTEQINYGNGAHIQVARLVRTCYMCGVTQVGG